MSLLTRWKEKRELEREASRLQHSQKRESLIAEAEDRITIKEQEMLSKPCPFLDMQNCKKECAHFQAGFVNVWYWVDEWCDSSKAPKCKLWR